MILPAPPPLIPYHLWQRNSSWDILLEKAGSCALPGLPCHLDSARLSCSILSQRPSRAPWKLVEHTTVPEQKTWPARRSPEELCLHCFPNKPAQISFVSFLGGWSHLLPDSSLLGQTRRNDYVYPRLSNTACKCHNFHCPLCVTAGVSKCNLTYRAVVCVCGFLALGQGTSLNL